MEDPKRQAWLYVGAGVLAVVMSSYFLATQGMGAGTFGVFDWVILGMGIVALYRGVRGLLDLRRSEATRPSGAIRVPRPKGSAPATPPPGDADSGTGGAGGADSGTDER